MDLAYIPSPSRGVVHLGPLPLRGYALCIIIGVIVAIWLGERRWIARGGRPGTVMDIAVWAVPFGMVGGRLYHVITTPGPYFGDGGDPMQAFAVWKGGLGIWGAILLGGVGTWIACRRRGIPMPAMADALAPGIVLAQAVGRWGNWFNQELYGKATDLPWAVKIDADHSPDGIAGTYHPTFLYESLWCVGVAALVIWADRRFKLGHGRAFALYVAAYTIGRFWVEYLRIDEAEHFLGMRLNNWTSILVFAGALAYISISAQRHPAREEPASLKGTRPVEGEGEGGDDDADRADDEPAAADREDERGDPVESAAEIPDADAGEREEEAPRERSKDGSTRS
ncbi:prolipoprotein diacylglyceryl transferase [Yinghuangia sp. ASG 101]|uniref:prolipoprotein diacylglyceryl transferase n=1 Tax=Yinghuangia sp. ASG 101 TaxID=2896848 RepID=UPI001E651FC5|nr:prolipoprotein diacylglyceryl transferase [Yinghuangia sp. ASG 101]UGQ10107.1 prolipoprotein diacylglyceryl transferase [Yinghuangia sp. ASG 101]